MNVWKCKLIFPTDTLQQKIEITDLKPFLAAGNISVVIMFATTVYPNRLVTPPVVGHPHRWPRTIKVLVTSRYYEEVVEGFHKPITAALINRKSMQTSI